MCCVKFQTALYFLIYFNLFFKLFIFNLFNFFNVWYTKKQKQLSEAVNFNTTSSFSAAVCTDTVHSFIQESSPIKHFDVPPHIFLISFTLCCHSFTQTDSLHVLSPSLQCAGDTPSAADGYHHDAPQELLSSSSNQTAARLPQAERCGGMRWLEPRPSQLCLFSSASLWIIA